MCTSQIPGRAPLPQTLIGFTKQPDINFTGSEPTSPSQQFRTLTSQWADCSFDTHCQQRESGDGSTWCESRITHGFSVHQQEQDAVPAAFMADLDQSRIASDTWLKAESKTLWATCGGTRTGSQSTTNRNGSQDYTQRIPQVHVAVAVPSCTGTACT